MSWWSKHITQSTSRISRGLANTLKFWDPKKVKKGVRQQMSAKLDPLGNFFAKGLSGAPSTSSSSARGWTEIPGTTFRRYY